MASPIKSNMGVPSFSVLVNGTEMGVKYAVKSVIVTKEINKVSKAKLVLFDGNPADQVFEASASADFDPNKSITIKMGYDQIEEQVFSGIITAQSLKVRFKSSELIVSCMDKSSQMATTRKTTNFVKKKDSDVISEIIGVYGLTKTVSATNFEHPNLVQYNCSDWDFILARADANAMVVINEDAKLTIAEPVVSGSAVLDVNFGIDILDFSADMDALNQLDSVEFQSWHSENLDLVMSSGTEPSVNAQGDITGKKLSEVGKSPKLTLNTSTPEDSSLLKSWAKSHLQHARLSKIRGFASFVGNSAPIVGKLLNLEGFSPHFNGLAYITKVVHTFEAGFWKTETGFGLQPKTFSDEGKIEGPSALGLLPTISGIHIGKVKKIDTDPAGEYRVQVDVPFIETAGEGLWARLSHPHASTDYGYYFYPDVGDEVILSFVNNDPRFAVIIGSLYGKKNKPPFTPENTNKDKAIVTKNKLKLTFEDVKKIITIETPGGQKVTLDDEGKSLKLEDQNNNSVLLDDKGITFDSGKDLILKSSGKITLTSGAVTEIKSGADLKVQGTNISLKASAKVGLEGATAEVKSSGNVDVKGGMINLN
ncbi:MAG: type VI secretion protein VgrG [Flammeovirgaceae bacterium]|nr:type VI secretion protein VgrG [Flammeovirgaceae bacterium]